jgi:hypothetical protein
MSQNIRIASTHHVRVRFDCAIDVIWDNIVSGFGQGQRFERQGFRVEQVLDDPRAVLGGYRMWREDGDDPDERLTFVTERDHEARRFSLCTWYLGADARDAVVHATYAAVENVQGNWYQIDCHATQDLPLKSDASNDEAIAAIEKSKSETDRYLRKALEDQKLELECRHPGSDPDNTRARWRISDAS